MGKMVTGTYDIDEEAWKVGHGCEYLLDDEKDVVGRQDVNV